MQFRLCVLPINNNMHRYSESPVSRNCPLCTSATENDHHFFLVCPFYYDLRAIICVVNSPAVDPSVSVVLSWKYIYTKRCMSVVVVFVLLLCHLCIGECV